MPAYVTEAELELRPGTDPQAAGAAVTVELCGHWEHDGPCRWPHNNAFDDGGGALVFRTIYVAEPADERLVHERIERALRTSGYWSVQAVRRRPVGADERELAERLLGAPRLEEG